jgi:alpha,alpha-trehalose-phosphate synthase [UDP-forming]
LRGPMSRVVVVSNRLPVALAERGRGRVELVPGSGGLVTAMGALLRARGGLWIGWLGASSAKRPERLLDRARAALGYDLAHVPLSRAEVEGYYDGFANAVLWPMFHDFVSYCDLEPAYWDAYRRANHKFARAAAAAAEGGDQVWVHDYHLISVGAELRRLGVHGPLSFFLHIPFPSPDIFGKLPWRKALLDALLAYDLVGFQSENDRRNFESCVAAWAPDASVDAGSSDLSLVARDGRETAVGAFPISIDTRDFMQRAAAGEVSDAAAVLRASLPNQRLILGVDRLDYTKGIPQRIAAFERLLAQHPELRGTISLVQLVVPSRLGGPRYRDLKNEIDRRVGAVNGRYEGQGWTPIHYLFRSVSSTELLALYRVADVALVTPLRDGMNLVAKEYCAAKLDESGVLVLSEFAGAAAELGDALLVNPFDVEEVAVSIHRALSMPLAERKERMGRMRRHLAERDVFRWSESFLGAARGDGRLRPFDSPDVDWLATAH